MARVVSIATTVAASDPGVGVAGTSVGGAVWMGIAVAVGGTGVGTVVGATGVTGANPRSDPFNGPVAAPKMTASSPMATRPIENRQRSRLKK